MKKRKFVKTLIILLVLGIVFVSYCYLECRWIKIKKVNLISQDIPESFNGIKIIFISDIHHGPYFSIRRVEKLVNEVNELQPDLIILGGDYVHREAKYIIPCFEELKELKSNYGVYAVLGNHDHWEDMELTRKMMIENGFNICDNKSYWLRIKNDSIKIGGVGDLWEDDQYLDSTTHDLKNTDFSILISHSPDYIEEMDTELIDFVVSGHTHGGQMTLFGLWAPIVPSKYGQKYRYGLKNFGDLQAYITSGVGTITPPLRFFCRPEIVLIELKNE